MRKAQRPLDPVIRLLSNHPLISVCTMQSRQVQYTCEVRSVPPGGPHGGSPHLATNVVLRWNNYGALRVNVCNTLTVPSQRNRFPVVFAMRVTVAAPPALLPQEPVLADPIIVTLTYHRVGQRVWPFLLSVRCTHLASPCVHFRHEVPVLLLSGSAPRVWGWFRQRSTPTVIWT